MAVAASRVYRDRGYHGVEKIARWPQTGNDCIDSWGMDGRNLSGCAGALGVCHQGNSVKSQGQTFPNVGRGEG